jgi:hypothetical protein
MATEYRYSLIRILCNHDTHLILRLPPWTTGLPRLSDLISCSFYIDERKFYVKFRNFFLASAVAPKGFYNIQQP